MTAAVVALSVAVATLSGGIVAAAVVSWRRGDRLVAAVGSEGSLARKLDAAERARHVADKELQDYSRRWTHDRAAYERQLASARSDVAQLEADLAQCQTPEAVEARLARTLGLLTGREDPRP